MHSLSLSSRKTLSPKNLPKLGHGRVGKLFREASADLGFTSPTSPNLLFLELERKLQEQQREITSRDSEVKKVISKFETIAEAHKDQKDKYSKILGKYLDCKRQLELVKEENEKLGERMGMSKNNKKETKKGKVKELKEELEKR